jgi:hypothetical protein
MNEPVSVPAASIIQFLEAKMSEGVEVKLQDPELNSTMKLAPATAIVCPANPLAGGPSVIVGPAKTRGILLIGVRFIAGMMILGIVIGVEGRIGISGIVI